MSRIKRYYSAFNRYKRSNGYGIHSPFAFKFVLGVLRERTPYYCYEKIEAQRNHVIAKTRKFGRHPRIISSKNAKLLFRVVNYFNPKHILQIGTSYGVSTMSMLSVSSTSRVTLLEHEIRKHPVTDEVLEPYLERIQFEDSVKKSIKYYESTLDDDCRFIVINNISKEDLTPLTDYINYILADKEGVIVMRNLSRNPLMNDLWLDCKEMANYGMAFGNEKIAIIVIHNKLPKQDYFLWF